MKNAFRNTTQKYDGRPLALKAKGAVVMPICKYGDACLYKSSCIYRHPVVVRAPDESPTKICVPFVAGYCEFGEKCANLHPSAEKCEEYKSILVAKPCKFGAQCTTSGCLYQHPAKLNSNLNVQADCFIPQSVMDLVHPQNVPFYSSTSNSATFSTSSAPATIRKRKIPLELWINDYERMENMYFIKDCMEKFAMVNKPYSTDKFVSVKRNLKVRIVDLHFQTQTGCIQVLESIVPKLEPLKKDGVVEGVWIITGSGHHVQKSSHQKQAINGESVLFSTTKAYLDNIGIKYEIGVDHNGKQGAFYVPL